MGLAEPYCSNQKYPTICVTPQYGRRQYSRFGLSQSPFRVHRKRQTGCKSIFSFIRLEGFGGANLLSKVALNARNKRERERSTVVTVNGQYLRSKWHQISRRNHPNWELHAEASATLPSGNADDGEEKRRAASTLRWVGVVLLLLAAAVGGLYTSGYGPVLQDWAQNSVLGKSGFLAAFALIFLSEIGDKTFFIAGLLAMKVGRLCSFVGASLALALMTIISVGIGYAFKSVPDALKSSIPIGEILGVGLMVYFGIRTLKAAWDLPPEEDKGEAELEAAQFTVDEAEIEGKIKPTSFFASLLEVAALIFVAEWGDRSMLATVALGAAQSPIGVASGAILGHVIATALAVIGGSIASQYISEKMIGYIGGTLFLFFAAATHFGIL